MKKPRKNKFFYHYNRPESEKSGTPKMSLHFKKTCYIVDGIECNVPTRSKKNKFQPRMVMTGECDFICITRTENLEEIAKIY